LDSDSLGREYLGAKYRYRSKWKFEDEGVLVVPNIPLLKKELFDEAHHAKYIVHPGTMKMYKDLKRHF